MRWAGAVTGAKSISWPLAQQLGKQTFHTVLSRSTQRIRETESWLQEKVVHMPGGGTIMVTMECAMPPNPGKSARTKC